MILFPGKTKAGEESGTGVHLHISVNAETGQKIEPGIETKRILGIFYQTVLF